MVILCIKRPPKDEHSKDYDEFLVECAASSNVGDLTKLCVDMQNLRVQLRWMATAAKELAKELSEENRHIMVNAADAAGRYLAIERTTVAKSPSTMEELNALRETIKGATMMCFPRECSGVDALQRLAAVLDSEDAGEKERAIAHRVLSIIDAGAKTEDILEGPQALWWVGKQLDVSGDFSKYVGRNEKTKLVVKISKPGGHAPPRESALDVKTQQEMMAYWYRKQEEAKKLVEDDDISYANSEWANPSQLKSQLSGMSNVKYRPGAM